MWFGNNVNENIQDLQAEITVSKVSVIEQASDAYPGDHQGHTVQNITRNLKR